MTTDQRTTPNALASRLSAEILLLRILTGLGISSNTGAIKNMILCLDKHKGLGYDKELGKG